MENFACVCPFVPARCGKKVPVTEDHHGHRLQGMEGSNS